MLPELCLEIIIQPIIFFLWLCLSPFASDLLTDFLPDVKQPLLGPPGLPLGQLLRELLSDDLLHLLPLLKVTLQLGHLALELVNASLDDRLALVGRAGHKVGVS
jgi:hypothetical protein